MDNRPNFNVRVYCICFNKNKEVLILKEPFSGELIYKFPGGGLEFGEGTKECLEREFMEELNLKINNIKHLYTTDFFQPSKHESGKQLIAIYYTAQVLNPEEFKIIDDSIAGYKWVNLLELNDKFITLATDQKALEILKLNEY